MKLIKYITISFLLSVFVVACKSTSEKVKTPENTSVKKILFVVSSHNQLGNTDKKTGYWLSEVSHPWNEIKQAGYEIDFVSPKGGRAPIDPRSMDTNDSLNLAFLNDGTYQQKIQNTLKPSQVNPDEYLAIYFAGGHGAMWDFPNNKALAKITAHIYENGGIASSTCHGPSGLVNVKLSNGKYLVDGKNVSSFTNEEETEIDLTDVVPFSLENSLKANGANFLKAGLWQEQVTVDRRIITGQNPQSAKLVGKKIVETLKEESVSKSLKNKNAVVEHFKFDNIPLDTISEGITRRWFHAEKGQMTIFYLKKGTHVPWHKHPNEQISLIQKGKVKVKTIENGKEVFKIVSEGEVISFPENVPHEFWALEETVNLDVHIPVRQDWLSKELPDYLKNSK